MTNTPFKSYTLDGVTLTMWSYDSLIVVARRNSLFDQFDTASPLGNTRIFHGFHALMVHAHEVTFTDDITEAWALEFKAWWEQAAPLVKNMRFDEAWELYSALEYPNPITDFVVLGWAKTRRDEIPVSEEMTEAAAVATDPDFLAAAPKPSKRSRRRT